MLRQLPGVLNRAQPDCWLPKVPVGPGIFWLQDCWQPLAMSVMVMSRFSARQTQLACSSLPVVGGFIRTPILALSAQYFRHSVPLAREAEDDTLEQSGSLLVGPRSSQRFRCSLRQLSYAIKTHLKATICLPFAVFLWH